MPSQSLSSGGILACLLALGMLAPTPVPASTNDHVVLITIDGLAGFYWADPLAPLPTLRRLAAEGAQVQGLHVSNPATTWPNHTTLVTGVRPEKHSVLFNGLLVRGSPGEPVRIDPERNQSELIAVPTVYDRLHHAGYRTAAINWPCTRGASTLDDNFPDTPDRIGQMTPRLRAELIRARILDDAEEGSFINKNPAARDRAWTATAVHLIHTRAPNLLLLHLLATDVVQHRYGPQSSAAYAALAEADQDVAEVRRALESADVRGQPTLLIASDHGFTRPSKMINPNVVLRKAGLFRPGPHRHAQSVSEGGTAFVYLTNPATAQEDRARVIALLRGVEGIAHILGPEQYHALHLPDPAINTQTGDLLLVAKDGYTFSDEFFEDDVITPLPIPLGTHGYLATDPRMDGVLVAWGRGIKAGTKLGFVENIDVAPTIAALLGEHPGGIQGKALYQMLTGTARQ